MSTVILSFVTKHAIMINTSRFDASVNISYCHELVTFSCDKL